MLFLDKDLTNDFLNILTSKDIMESILHNSKIRGRVFEKKNLLKISEFGDQEIP